MSNIDKYNTAFTEILGVAADALSGLKYQDIPEWDSVGHMQLMGALEDAFDIMLDTDDIIDFSSYAKGREILAKYEVEL